MYSLTVRDHFMIAHSLSGEVFGPAQRLHGATFEVEATFFRRDLDSAGVVVDIGRATGALGEVLEAMDYRNLDEHPDFAGRNTTTEVLARETFDGLARRVREGDLGEEARGIHALRVTLRESPVALASFEGEI